MYANMEFWSEIRRRVLTGEMSKREACHEYEIHWKTLVKILTHEEPPGYRRTVPRRRAIEPMLPVIRQILDADGRSRGASETVRHDSEPHREVAAGRWLGVRPIAG